MLNQFIKFLNAVFHRINIILLVFLAIWSLLGVWNIIDHNNMLYWQVLFTAGAILIFNIALIYVVFGIYRDNLKIVDVFNESQYAQTHDVDSVIFRTGEKAKNMYLLTKGKVEIRKDGKVLEVIEPGGIFGEMAIIESEPRSADAVCIKHSKLIKINEKRFYELTQEVPFFALEVMKIMAHRIRKNDVRGASY